MGSFFFLERSYRYCCWYILLTNRYFDIDNDEAQPKKMFLSGSLHFGIKFYCSDEDESSWVLFFFSSVPTAVGGRLVSSPD